MPLARNQGSAVRQQTLWVFVVYATVHAFNSCTSRPDVCQCLVVQIPIDNMSKNKPSTSMTHVQMQLANQSHVQLWGHSYIHRLVTIGRAVVFYARAAHACCAGIKCRHCSPLGYQDRPIILQFQAFRSWREAKCNVCYHQRFPNQLNSRISADTNLWDKAKWIYISRRSEPRRSKM